MSVSLSADATVTDGVALVTLDVENPTPVRRQVRIANRLAGPVLPPRRNGVPEPGWDDDGVTAVVDARDSVALGYACPVGEREMAASPAELVNVGSPDGSLENVVTRARRDLGAFRPPRDAVPDGTPFGIVGPRDEHGPPGSGHESTTLEADGGPDSSGVPDEVADWLDDVETRVGLAERLTGVSVADATTALADGDRAPEELADAVDADVEALRTISGRAERLAARANATDVPVDALGRLA